MTMDDIKKDNTVTVSEVGPGPFVQSVTVRGHKLLADEPLSFPEGKDQKNKYFWSFFLFSLW